MRIQGFQIRGLTIPPGEHRLRLDSGYNVVLAGDGAQPLMRLLLSLLYPADTWEPPSLATGADASGARAILGLAERTRSFRIVADLAHERMAMARFESARGHYERVAADARGVAAGLRELGMPELRLFGWLHWLGGELPRVEPPAPRSRETRGSASHPAPRERPLATAAASGAEQLEAEEAKRLAELRERLQGAEEELTALRRTLAESAWLARIAALPELEKRVGRLQAAQSQRQAEGAHLEQLRRALQQESDQLRAQPALAFSAGQLAFAGTAIGASVGGAAWLWPAALPGVLATLGLTVGGALVLRAAAARRRIRVIEARLAGLRVREGSRSAGLPPELEDLSRVLARHALDWDGLRGAIAELRKQETRAAELEAEVAAGRAELRPERLQLLEQFEVSRAAEAAEAPLEPARAAQGPPVGVVAVTVAAALDEVDTQPDVTSPDARAAELANPDALAPELWIELAAYAARHPVAQVQEPLEAVLPIYLRAFTAGQYAQLQRNDAGWCARRIDRDLDVPLAMLAEPLRRRIALALRLALLEVIAPVVRVPVIVGPELAPRADQARVLARALGRLGHVLQVVHFAPEEAPYAQFSGRVQRLCA